MRALLFALIAQLGLTHFARSETFAVIPFEYRDGFIWIKVNALSRNGPLNFILDSGASASVVDLAQARTLGIAIGKPEKVQGVNGQALAYAVDNFCGTCCGVTLSTSLLAVDLKALSDCCHHSIDGILGADFFRGRTVQINFRAHEVRILKNCDFELANCEKLPIKVCNSAFCVPVRVGHGPIQWVRLDTGCDSALEWVRAKEQRSFSKQEPTEQSLSSAKFVTSDLQIGKQHYAVRTILHAKPIFSGEAGLLGNGLLEKFCLTIDEPRRQVILN
ncbi:MAG TPA: aspartyl protease family protein [Chthoniobacterales bacterium]